MYPPSPFQSPDVYGIRVTDAWFPEIFDCDAKQNPTATLLNNGRPTETGASVHSHYNP